MKIIDIDKVPYTGIAAPEGEHFYFTVVGQQNRIKDMLRYDKAIINGEPICLKRNMIGDEDYSEYQIRIASKRLTPKRWNSFGFAITSEVQQK